MDTTKKSMIRRFLAVLLSAFILVTYMPEAAYAENEQGAIDIDLQEVPTYIKAGEELSFQMNLPEETFARMKCGYVSEGNEHTYDDQEWGYSTDIDVGIDTSNAPAGAIVYVSVYAWTDNGRSTAKTIEIPVVGSRSDDVEIAAPTEEVSVNDAVDIVVHTKGNKIIEAIRFFDGHEFRDGDTIDDDDTRASASMSFDSVGEHRVLAVVKLDGSDSWVSPDPITVNVKANGVIGGFDINSIEYGQYTAITIGDLEIDSCPVDDLRINLMDYAQNADRYWVDVKKKIHVETDGIGSYRWYGRFELVDNSEKVLDFNARNLEAGTYFIEVGAGAPGFETRYADATITWNIKNHELEEHPAVAETCTTSGNTAYWSCEDCGKYFEDENGTKEIAADSWIIPAKHQWNEGVEDPVHTDTENGVMTYTCNVCGETKTEMVPSNNLETARTGAKTELDNYKNPADYRTAQKTELANAIQAGKDAIDAAADEEAVATALENAKAAIDNIETDAQMTAEELATAKDTAKAALDDYKDPADYRTAQKTELANAIQAGKDAIDAATDEAGVATALENAKAAIDKIKTNAQLTAEEEAAKPKTKPERVDLKAVKGLKVRGAKKKLTVRWKKATKKEQKTFQGYEIQYTLNGTFKDYPAKRVSKKKASATLKKLLKKKKYTVRIRRYRDDGSVLHVSAWKKKKAKVK